MDVSRVNEIYSSWEEKWKSSAVDGRSLSPISDIVSWHFEAAVSRTIIPQDQSQITAIFVAHDSAKTYGRLPVENPRRMLVLWNGDEELEHVCVAPKDGVKITDDLLVDYVEKWIAEGSPADGIEHDQLIGLNKGLVDLMQSAVRIQKDPGHLSSFMKGEIIETWGKNHIYDDGAGNYTKPQRLKADRVIIDDEDGSKKEAQERELLLPKEAIDELAELLFDIHRQIHRDAWQVFAAHLNADVMKQFETGGVIPEANDYAFLSKKGRDGERRNQGIEQFPFLSDYIGIAADRGYMLPLPVVNETDEGKYSVKMIDVRTEMERDGKSVLDSIAEAAKVDRRVVKRIAGMPAHSVMGWQKHHIVSGEFSYSHLISLIGSIEDLNSIPFRNKEPEKFDALVDVILAVKEISPGVVNTSIRDDEFPPQWLGELVGGIKGDMRPFVEKRESAQELRQEARNIKDYVNAVMDLIVLPEIVRRVEAQHSLRGQKINYDDIVYDVEDALMETLFKGRTVSQLFGVSERWHRIEAELEDSIRTEERRGTWGKLIEDTPVPAEIAPSGLTIVALNTARELKHEGRAMHHCVGGQSQRCMREKLHVLSIRDANGNSISTPGLLEKSDSSDSKGLTVEQHQGPANKTPPDEAKAALDWLLEEVEAGRINIDYYSMQSAREKALAAEISVVNRIGFDPKNDERLELAFTKYRDADLLPKGTATREEFLEGALSNAIESVFSKLHEGKYRIQDEPEKGV